MKFVETSGENQKVTRNGANTRPDLGSQTDDADESDQLPAGKRTRGRQEQQLDARKARRTTRQWLRGLSIDDLRDVEGLEEQGIL